MGAPGLAFETWDPSNQFRLDTPTRLVVRSLLCYTGSVADQRDLKPTAYRLGHCLQRHAFFADSVINRTRLGLLEGQSIKTRHVGDMYRRPAITTVADVSGLTFFARDSRSFRAFVALSEAARGFQGASGLSSVTGLPSTLIATAVGEVTRNGRFEPTSTSPMASIALRSSSLAFWNCEILTCPSRLAQQMLSRYGLHEIKAPPEIPAFNYFMFWHPRLTDENLHSWFREFVLASCAREFGNPKR
jgi:hypothetical protein